MVALAVDKVLDDQLLGVTVQLRHPIPYAKLIHLTQLSAALHDCTPPSNERVLRHWAVVYARDNLFEVSNLQPLIERAGSIKADGVAWPPIYLAIRQEWPELVGECPTISWSAWRLPFHASVIQERRRLYDLMELLNT